MKETSVNLVPATKRVVLGVLSPGQEDLLIPIMSRAEIEYGLPMHLLGDEQLISIIQSFMVTGINRFAEKVGLSPTAKPPIGKTMEGLNSMQNALLAYVLNYEMFSARFIHCVRAADIEYVYQAVAAEHADLLKLRNFGKKSLAELKDYLSVHDISSEMIGSIRRQYREIEAMPLGSFREITESAVFAEMCMMVSTIEDLSILPIGEWKSFVDIHRYYRYHTWFPYRHKNTKYTPNAFEASFPLDKQRDQLRSLSNQLSVVAAQEIDKLMVDFIKYALMKR